VALEAEATAAVALEMGVKVVVAWVAEATAMAGKAAVAWEAEATEMGVKVAVAVALEAEVGAGSSSTPRATACWRLSYQHGCVCRSRC